MLNPAQLNAARIYINETPASFRRRGREYFNAGAVQSVECEEPGRVYTALVKGSREYTVTMFFEEDVWDAECSCPMQFDCKHCVAAMLTLIGPDGVAQATAPRTIAAVMQEKVKRPLLPAETKLANRLRALHQQSRYYYQGIYFSALQPLFPGLQGSPWGFLNCWPHPPKDELEWWEYLAIELQSRGVVVPEALMAIVDADAVRKRFTDWKRNENIVQWQNILSGYSRRPQAASAKQARVVDIRLQLTQKRIGLEWREAGTEKFQPLKTTRFRDFADEYSYGALEVSADTVPIWQPFYQRHLINPYTPWNTADEHFRQLLGSMLRLPVARALIVGDDGEPLRFVPEPLRWELAEQANDYGDYRLRLVTSDGQPAPHPWLRLPGAPTLYLCENTVFSGPSPVPVVEGKDTRDVVLPKPVVESRAGLTFLQQIGAPMPVSLREKVKVVPVRLRFTVTLAKEKYGEAEWALLRVQAHATGFLEEFVTGDLWRSVPQKNDELIVHDRAALSAVPGAMQAGEWKWENYSQCWRWRVTKKFPERFTQWLAALPGDAELKLDPTLATLRDAPVAGKVRLDCQPSGVDWFDLAVVLDVADTKLTPEELKALLNAKGGFVRLGAKGWHRLQLSLTNEDEEQLSRLGLSTGDFSAEPQRLHALQLADRAAARFLPEAQVAAIHRRAEELQTRVNPPVPEGIRAELRPYQVEGFHFLGYLAANRFGGILADDMGLGKTLQTLTWLAWLRAQPGNSGSSLVVCPKSVMDNWRAEAARFLPGVRLAVWQGTDAAALPETAAGCDLLVLNYTQLRSVAEGAAKVKWLAVILDEGQYIKNPESQTAKAARALPAEYRLVLTGTPIENRLLDLWSLMSFAMPGALGNRAQFAKRFDQANDLLARRRLSARVRPFLLRRTKGQVAKELPERIEEDLLCEMEGAQQTLYRAELKHAQQMLLGVKTKAQFDKQRFNFLTSLLRLRQICCHPGLVDAKHAGSASAKLEALTDLIEPLMDEGHKVLVFSQFVTMLDLVEPVVQERGWKYFRLTGETDNRGELVEKFQKTGGGAVFLISLKAGGFGLNLTAASYVVLFDPWWNPAVEAQAIDRTHRIGQTRHVNAYRLLMKGSIEEKIRALQKTKRALAEDILGEERFAQSLTLDDLRYLFADTGE
jgi:hypothetical protein